MIRITGPDGGTCVTKCLYDTPCMDFDINMLRETLFGDKLKNN